MLKHDGKLVDMDSAKILDDAQTITTEIWEALFNSRRELRNLVKS